jgi:hypothetical protein
MTGALGSAWQQGLAPDLFVRAHQEIHRGWTGGCACTGAQQRSSARHAPKLFVTLIQEPCFLLEVPQVAEFIFLVIPSYRAAA